MGPYTSKEENQIHQQEKSQNDHSNPLINPQTAQLQENKPILLDIDEKDSLTYANWRWVPTLVPEIKPVVFVETGFDGPID